MNVVLVKARVSCRYVTRKIPSGRFAPIGPFCRSSSNQRLAFPDGGSWQPFPGKFALGVARFLFSRNLSYGTRQAGAQLSVWIKERHLQRGSTTYADTDTVQHSIDNTNNECIPGAIDSYTITRRVAVWVN